MGQTKGLALLAGAALSLTGVVNAQSSTDQTRAIVAEAMADAETRSSLLAAGDAGHDGKFFIAGDGFRLNVGGQIQFRYLMNFRDDDNVDDFDPGFQTRRTKIDFNGTIYRDWEFRVLGGFSRSGGSFTLEEAWGRYVFANGLKMRFGQFKLPLLREELVSSARQLTVERSIVNELFTQDRSQGIELSYEQENWRAAAAFSDGLDSENTDFDNDPLTFDPTDPAFVAPFRVAGEADYAFTGRVEFLAAGNWKQFEDFTSPKGSDFGALIGLAAHWQESSNTNNPTDIDRDVLQFTGDVSLEGDSWNVFLAGIGRWESFSTLADDEDLFDWGFVAQAGWRFAENTEVFGRWDGVFADEDRAGFDDEDNFNFITAGFNHYFAGHAAKFTLDAVWSLNETEALQAGTGILDTGLGLLGSVEEHEVTVRAQFQLLF